jgi:hypothetical protein
VSEFLKIPQSLDLKKLTKFRYFLMPKKLRAIKPETNRQMMSSAIANFCNEHGLTIEQENQLKGVFIDLLLEKCTIQVKDFKFEEAPKPMEVDEPVKMVSANKNGKAKAISTKKFSTIKTEEYAKENDLCLDDFDIDGKITKNDVIQLIKKRSKSAGPSTASRTEQGSTSSKKQKTATEKNSCHALTKTGDNCKTRAKADKPDGANFHYCPKHFDNWKMFEEHSDTEDEDDTESVADPEPLVPEFQTASQELMETLNNLEIDDKAKEDEFEAETDVDEDPEKVEKYPTDEESGDEAEPEDEGDEVTEEDLFN